MPFLLLSCSASVRFIQQMLGRSILTSYREALKSVGQSGSLRFGFSRSVAGLQARVPLLELPSERAIEGSRSGLKEEMCTRL